MTPVTETDVAAVTAQLGRPPRGLLAVVARCPSGHPAAVATNPKLPDGSPFPTLYYLTCPKLCSLVGTLEAGGVMRAMTERLATDPDLAAAYRVAHVAYLADRDAIAPLGTDFSAGGMPDRVKCLHALLAHALAAGPGVNPFGDETLTLVRQWWPVGDCAAQS